MFFLLLFVLLISDLMSHYLIQGAKDLLPLFFFSPKRFIVLALTLMTLMHFESVFKCGVREGSSFVPSLVDMPLAQPLLLQRLFFLC